MGGGSDKTLEKYGRNAQRIQEPGLSRSCDTKNYPLSTVDKTTAKFQRHNMPWIKTQVKKLNSATVSYHILSECELWSTSCVCPVFRSNILHYACACGHHTALLAEILLLYARRYDVHALSFTVFGAYTGTTQANRVLLFHCCVLGGLNWIYFRNQYFENYHELSKSEIASYYSWIPIAAGISGSIFFGVVADR